MVLRKVQRNDIFRAVEAGGLDPSKCEFSYQHNSAYLRHGPSKSTLSIGGDGQGHYMLREEIGENKPDSYGAGDWADVLPHIEHWASDVKSYTEMDAQIPDLWAELRRDADFLSDVQYEEGENTPFDADEQAEIARRLREIKENAQQQYSLTAQQMDQLKVRLNEVEEASGRIGRKDWVLMFYGAL